MKRLLLVLALASLAAAAIAVAAVGAPGGGGKAAKPPGSRGNPFAGVNFVTVCGFSHASHDDPIVFPGQPGASHRHSFLGNTSTAAGSTLETLLAAGTTCRRPADTAAYWVPSLFVGGKVVEPIGATVYYRRSTFARVEAFPAGLRMIAGDARALGPQSARVAFWSCGPRGAVSPQAVPPVCDRAGRGVGLRLHVRFRSCWDGVRLDSDDHTSHMAYPTRRRCPASHPVSVPALTLIVRYPLADGGGVELASGGVHSAHADFFNAWNQRRLESLVDRCLNGLRRCGR